MNRSVPDATVSMPGQPIGNEDTFNLSAAPPAPADRLVYNILINFMFGGKKQTPNIADYNKKPRPNQAIPETNNLPNHAAGGAMHNRNVIPNKNRFYRPTGTYMYAQL